MEAGAAAVVHINKLLPKQVDYYVYIDLVQVSAGDADSDSDEVIRCSMYLRSREVSLPGVSDYDFGVFYISVSESANHV